MLNKKEDFDNYVDTNEFEDLEGTAFTAQLKK
jgi:hypothetical protein